MRTRNERGEWNGSKTLAAALVLVAGVAAAGQAQAQIPAPEPRTYGPPRPMVMREPQPEPARAPLGISVSAGLRSDLIRSAGLDPFSGTDRVGQGALGVGYRFGDPDAAGLSVGFDWNRGSLSAQARSASAELTLDRLTVGIEGRYPLLRRLAVFGRVAPGLLRSHARLYEPSAPADPYAGAYGGGGMMQTKWSPAADVGAGLAFHFADVRSPGVPVVGFWLIADGGFGFSPAYELTLRGHADPLPGRTDEPIRLGSLTLSGGFARARVAVSF